MAEDVARLIWSLSSAGGGTSLVTSGNSGGWSSSVPNAKSAVDVRWTDDVWLSVAAGGGSGTTLKVLLNAYDDLGNLLGGSTGLLAVTLAAAPGSSVAFGGRHGGGGSGSYFVLSEWAQISWTLTGTMTGCEIALYGRG